MLAFWLDSENQMTKRWHQYSPIKSTYDELISSNRVARPIAKNAWKFLSSLNKNQAKQRQELCQKLIRDMGISFTVYGEGSTIDRNWPLDIVPRLISASQWQKIERGLKQRLRALNLFINDLYHKQHVLKDKVIPDAVVLNSPHLRKVCRNVNPVGNIWAHICGTDLVRDSDGEFYVLEDNLRIPSGVSYVLENRLVMKKMLPELFSQMSIRSVDSYPNELLKMLLTLSPRRVKNPHVVVLTPGVYNSAYFEHSYLAHQMGVELVEGQDLFVDSDKKLYMKTIYGPKQVDVLYRRVDDDFLDPRTFDPDSLLGVPGIMAAWKARNLTLVNAPGAGVADDKVIYSFVPKLIKYYLSEEPLLPNVQTWLCLDKKSKDYVLENIHELVVKPANASGGYGIMVGPKSSKKEHQEYKKLIEKSPRHYIAQTPIQLSTAPTMIGGKLEPRHLDLRPFTLMSKDSAYVLPGGLTRVALRQGSLIVNSSQGGGSKDTWVVGD